MALNAIVRTNITSLNAHRKLSGAGIQQAQASQQLASGKRINSAADDVAGLGIVEKMRAQISGLDRASLNAQDGMSLVQTAEGALSSITDALIRMRELVIQAANDTNVHDENALNQSDRISIQDEIDQLLFEINNIAYRTEFNTRTLLDGSLSGTEGTWHNLERVSIKEINIINPARITTLDQFLRMPANIPFEGSFADLLREIGVNSSGLEIHEWMATNGATNFDDLPSALDRAMGVGVVTIEAADLVLAVPAINLLDPGSSLQEVRTELGNIPELSNRTPNELDELARVIHTMIQNGIDPADMDGDMIRDWAAGSSSATSTQWQQLEVSAGLRFRNATELLNAFVQGLHNPNALRGGGLLWNAPQRGFENWQNFLDEANPSMGATTFARAVSTAGGETMYQALRRTGFAGLDPDATFGEIRNVFYQMDSSPNGGWANGVGINGDLARHLNIRPEPEDETRSWLETLFGREFREGPPPSFPTQELANATAWEHFVAEYLTAVTEVGEREIQTFGQERGIPLWFHIGANAGQGIFLNINAMHTRSLGDPNGDLADLIDVENPSGRPISDQVQYLDEALSRVTRQRSLLGAVYNRLEFARIGLDISSENLTASMSRIRDADMAKAMMDFYKSNVLTQAATAMIAQSNQTPQAILELLQ